MPVSKPPFGAETCLRKLLDQVNDTALDPEEHKDIIDTLAYLVITVVRPPNNNDVRLKCPHESCDFEPRVKRARNEVEAVSSLGRCGIVEAISQRGKV